MQEDADSENEIFGPININTSQVAFKIKKIQILPLVFKHELNVDFDIWRFQKNFNNPTPINEMYILQLTNVAESMWRVDKAVLSPLNQKTALSACGL